MYAAVYHMKSLPLVLWLLDEKGADVNKRTYNKGTPLHGADSLDILNALLTRGADPTLLNSKRQSPFMYHARYDEVSMVERMLRDSRVRATVDMQVKDGHTALNFACCRDDDAALATSLVHLLLLVGTNPTLFHKDGWTPLVVLRRCHPTYTTTVALLAQAIADAEVTSLLVKARRLVFAALTTMLPYLQGRWARGEPLPRVILVPVTGGNKRAKKRRIFRSMLGFIFGIKGGPKGQGMPRDAFRDVLMDLFMPVWDPLRRGNGTGPPLPG